jgi:hypothetical protein
MADVKIADDLKDLHQTCGIILGTEGCDEPWVALTQRYIERTSRAEEELKHAELAFSIWDSLAPIDLKIKVGDEIRRRESVGGLSVCSPSTTPNPEKQ